MHGGQNVGSLASKMLYVVILVELLALPYVYIADIKFWQFRRGLSYSQSYSYR